MAKRQDKVRKKRQRYQTQWSAQFYTAAELTRRGYLVSMTLGNAPVTDLLVISPKGTHFQIDVKGQVNKSYWLIGRRNKAQKDLFYILVYIPKGNSCPEFSILRSSTIMKLKNKHRQKRKSEGKLYNENMGGIDWKAPNKYKSKWNILPK